MLKAQDEANKKQQVKRAGRGSRIGGSIAESKTRGGNDLQSLADDVSRGAKRDENDVDRDMKVSMSTFSVIQSFSPACSAAW